MEAGASNTGGGASDGIGMGIGLAMANRMNESIGNTGSSASPPPLPGGSEVYHVAQNGAAQGPYTIDLLKQHASAGSLQTDTLVWSPSMSEWQAAGTVDELKSVFENSASSPPPIPSA